MSTTTPRLLITGANGQLGRLVIEHILKRDPDADITATVRTPAAGAELAKLGVTVAVARYDDAASLDAAYAGIDRLLLISAMDIGARVGLHANAIAAAQRAGVGLIAYTSLVHASASRLSLAIDHRATERALSDSGVPFAVLRNGWYSENDLAGLDAAFAHGTMLGSAGDGRISFAARSDYAEAAAAVLLNGAASGTIYELAGDDAYTRTQLAAIVSEQSGKPVTYTNLPESEYQAALLAAGLPDHFAAILADSDAAASEGWLFDDSRTLSALIGHATTPLAATVAAALDARAASVPERR